MDYLVYTPEKGFFGDDTFDCTVTDSGGANTADVHVTVHVTLPVSLAFDAGLNAVSADEHKSEIDAQASVTGPADGNGNLPHLDDGTTIQWRVKEDGGSLDQAQTTTTDGDAANVLHTTRTAGDSFTVYAKVVKAAVDGGPALDYAGPEVAVLSYVTPGAAAQMAFATDSPDGTLPADGTSTTRVTATVRDAAGNLVENGTPIDWVIEGDGSLSDANASVVGGRASVTLQSGLFPGDIKLVAQSEGYDGAVVVPSRPVNVQVGVTGNVLTLGSTDTAQVTATVTDPDGRPVADGTPITWYAQKGAIQGDAVVTGGVAHATLLAVGGSQIPGNGSIRAFVGSVGGAVGYLWVLPATPPPTGQLVVAVKNTLLAGDLKVDGSVPVDQADGSQVSYQVHAQTDGTITNGDPGATVLVNSGTPDAFGGGLLAVVGDNGQPGPTAAVTLDAQGRGTFRVVSTGILLPNQAIVVPVTLQEQGYIFNGPTTTLNVAVQPAGFIARSLDLVSNIGWGIATGDGDSTAAVVGDMAFSMIPIVGAYSDIRDITKEVLKFWPGGESPNWWTFGFALFGVAGSFLGPEVDWLPTLGKKMAQTLDANKGVWKGVMELAKGADLARLNAVKDLLVRMVNGALSGDGRLRDMAEKFLVNSTDDLANLGKLTDGLGDDAVDFLQRVAADPNLGEAVAKSVVDLMGSLKPAQLADIKAAGKLDEVAASIAKGMPQDRLAAYADWLNAKKADPTARIPFSSDSENLIDQLLLSEGRKVEPNLLAQEWVSGAAGKQGDRFVDGVKTELKAISDVVVTTQEEFLKKLASKITKNRSQAPNFILWVKDQAGMTEEIARATAKRAFAYDLSKGPKLESLRFIGENFDKIFHPPGI